MTVSAINRILGLFLDAFRDLSVAIPIEDAERLAVVVHHSMQHGRRSYHTSAHIFDLASGMNARQTLAVLFHDVVYYQVDCDFPEKAKALLETIVRSADGQLVLRPYDREDAPVAMCAELFGFEPGSTLPATGGANEFLSAIVATRLLQPYLRPADLLAIATCIEATIPFRGPGAANQPVFDGTAERVRVVGERKGSGLTAGDVSRIVTDAVVLANRDVHNFAAADPGAFLATTWMLIEESNPPLEYADAYSIQEYRRALMGMGRFVVALDPDRVFHSYAGTPGDAALAALQAAATRNLAFATHYLGGKIVSMALLEALALETGGDCPVAMILGDLYDPAVVPEWTASAPRVQHERDTDPALLDMFENGRPGKSDDDLATSPMTAHIYRREGHARMVRALAQARRMFAGEQTPREFLATLRPGLVRWVAGACARVSPSRAAKLNALAAQF